MTASRIAPTNKCVINKYIHQLSVRELKTKFIKLGDNRIKQLLGNFERSTPSTFSLG